MITRWVRTHEEFAALAPAWDAALARWGGDNPFLYSDFALTWTQAFVPEGELRILVCFEGGAVVGGLPLYRWRRAPGLPVLCTVFAYLTEPFYTTGEAEFSAACAGALGEARDWIYLMLGLSRRPLLGPEQAAWWRQTMVQVNTGARICLAPGQDAESYLAGCKLKHRTNVRRRLRLAHAAGGVELRRENDPEAIAALVEFQLRHNGPDRYPRDKEIWASREAWKEFYRNLYRRLARRGAVDALGLHIGGELAAVALGLRHGPGFNWMQMSHDSRFRRLGPGELLIYHVIDWCARQGDPYIEMYVSGDDEHKRPWCNVFQPLYRVRVFPDTALGRALGWTSRVTGRI